jgi:hypothetical protein
MSPTDEDLFAIKVETDEGFRARAIPIRNRLECRRRHDREVRFEVGELVPTQAPEELVREEPVPCEFSDHPEADPMGRIGSHVAVDDEQIPTLEVSTNPVEKGIENVGFYRLIDVAPIDAILGPSLRHDETIIGRTAGAAAGTRDQGSGLSQLALTTDHCQLDQFRRTEISVDGPGTGDTYKSISQIGRISFVVGVTAYRPARTDLLVCPAIKPFIDFSSGTVASDRRLDG